MRSECDHVMHLFFSFKIVIFPLQKTLFLTMRAALLSALAVTAAGHDTVYRLQSVSAEVASDLMRTPCERCNDEGVVDIWKPDGLHESSLLKDAQYEMDIRGGDELVEKMKKHNITFGTLIESVEDLTKSSMNTTTVGANFHDSYHPLNEIYTQLEHYLTLGAQKLTIGASEQGHPIAGVKFGNMKSRNIVYLQCGIHAREWISPAACMFYLEKMLKGKDSEPMKSILSDLQVYIVPVLNTDGYLYTWSTNRMWRKNRKNNGDGSFGVDLNRNWADHWGLCGSSSNPSSDTYRGTGPFSESESAAIRDLFAKLKFDGYHIQAGVDFHAYGQLILRPYGWTLPTKACPGASSPPCVPPNEEFMRGLGSDMQSAIRETSGLTYSNEHAAELYCAAGGADDWLAISTVQANGFCLELRDTGRYGFVLPANQIIPTGEEVYQAMVSFLQTVVKSIE